MALARQFSAPTSDVTTINSANSTVTQTVTGAVPGWNIGVDSFQSPTIITAPPSSASVFAPASYVAQTASVATVVQNTLGYDAQFVAHFQGAASVASFQVGVGATNAPAATTVAASLTSATAAPYTFPAYVPNGYFFSFQVIQANAASVPSAQLTIMAYPV